MSSQSNTQDYEETQEEFVQSMASMASGGWISQSAFQEATGESYSSYVQKKTAYNPASSGAWYGQMSYETYVSEYQLDTPEEQQERDAYWNNKQY